MPGHVLLLSPLVYTPVCCSFHPAHSQVPWRVRPPSSLHSSFPFPSIFCFIILILRCHGESEAARHAMTTGHARFAQVDAA